VGAAGPLATYETHPPFRNPLPVLPVVALFDGAVSCLRTYGVEELRELTLQLGGNDHHGEVGTVKSTTGPIPVTY
jgi:hypothetical protein